MNTVDKEIDGCEATGQEGSPPPVVILYADKTKHVVKKSFWPKTEIAYLQISNIYEAQTWSYKFIKHGVKTDKCVNWTIQGNMCIQK